MRGWVCHLELLLVLASAVILKSESRGTSQILDSPTWRARSLYSYPPRMWLSGHTFRHWVPFSSPHTTRRATVQVFNPASTSHSESHIATDGRSVSKSWCRAPSGAHDEIFIIVWQVRSCYCEAPSRQRGRVCLLYMLLALASAVFLWSESLGTCDRILLSHIWDFPFHRLVRLAGSRWRYLTPLVHVV
jgi:hypothetical protein